jgi:3D (Asp-Asp-Asp) domain-containing protein
MLGAAYAAVTHVVSANQAVTVANDTANYIVRPGETLGYIAQSLHTTVDAITSLNGLKDPNLIIAGVHLRVPTKEPGLPSNSQAIVCELTAYTDNYSSTGKNPGDPGYGITSTGDMTREGFTVAVDPSIIPYGTPIYIPGIGIRIADDTGGAIVGNHIDVFYNNDQTALEFGVKQNVVAYIIPKQNVIGRYMKLSIAPIRVPKIHTVSGASALSSHPEQSSMHMRIGITNTRQALAHISPRINTSNLAQEHLLSRSLHSKNANAIRSTTPHIDKKVKNHSNGRVDVLDVWDIALDRCVWQPILKVATLSF